MMNHAKGSFEVKISPSRPQDEVDGIALGRMTLEKVFQGDLEASGKGEMLTAGTKVGRGGVVVGGRAASARGRGGAAGWFAEHRND